MKCPICLDENGERSRVLYDDRYGYPGTFNLAVCSNCRHHFLSHEFNSDQIIDLYNTRYPRSTFSVEMHKVPRKAHALGHWMNGADSSAMYWVPPGVRVLDIGCGFGESLGYHASRGCAASGVEADENIRRVADKFGYDVRVGLFNSENYAAASFDFVTMNQVIEHVMDPVAILSAVASVLKPGGTLVVTTPNPLGWGARLFGKRWLNWHAPYHLQFFSVESMRLAAAKANLQVDVVRTITNSDWLGYQWAHCFMYPQPLVPSPFWRRTDGAGIRDRLSLSFFSALHRTKINHLITRCFDAFAMGDNFVFILRK